MAEVAHPTQTLLSQSLVPLNQGVFKVIGVEIVEEAHLQLDHLCQVVIPPPPHLLVDLSEEVWRDESFDDAIRLAVGEAK